MKKDDLVWRIIEIISNVLAIDMGRVKSHAELVTNLGASGTDIIAVRDALEQGFVITITKDQMRRWRRVEDVINCVTQLFTEQRKETMNATETTATTAERVIRVIAERLGLTPGEINRTGRLVEDYNADNSKVADIILGIEEEFSWDISDKEAKTLETVEDIICHIERATGAGQNKERKQ